jgi:hypothetical protein
MKTIKCDRCGKDIPYVPSYMNCAKKGIVPPKITAFVWEPISYTTREVDLCEECQNAVYGYIFDFGNGVGS